MNKAALLAVLVGAAAEARADLVESGFPYSYADETGSKVDDVGRGGVLRLRGSLASGGDVYGGVGLVFEEPKATVDASAYTGVVFKARRTSGSAAHVRFKVPDIATDPAGGVCKDCFNDFGITFEVGEQWTRYEVAFADLAQETGWGDPRPDAVDASKIYGLQWQVTVPGARLDIEIDDVQFLGADGQAAEDSGSVFGGIGVDPGRPRGAENGGDGSLAAGADGYRLAFHGFLRIPLRIGRGGGKMHTPPQIPDGNYTDWRYTNVSGGPWTELWLKYSNGTVTANIVLAAYDVSDASYRDLLSQLGISQSFLTFDLPRLFGERGGLTWNVGAFSNRYGTAARYDAGKYDTYLFGATHVAGETVSAHYRLNDKLTLAVDHGIGAKLQIAPLTDVEAPFLPYPGDVQQGSTYLHHAHVGAVYGGWLTVAAHYLSSWTDDARLSTEVDGRVTNLGVDAKALETKWGDAYVGWSHLIARDPLRVAGAFEVLHSFEGWNLRDNYFGAAATGSGSIDTILFEYVYGVDEPLTLSAFGMYNRIRSDDPLFDAPTQKLKLGAEGRYAVTGWLAALMRYDAVQPNLADDRYSFHVFSPGLVLRTSLASHEEVVLGYSHYRYGELVAPGYPHEALAADRHVFRVTAIMWW